MTIMARRAWTVAAFTVYVAAIVLSNWMILHVGTPGPNGVHTVPVGPGLTAPSGVAAAALTFPARDVVQRLGGQWWGLAAVIIGATVAWLVASPAVAAASGITYLCSEGLDFAVYSLLQRRWYRLAVAASVGLAIVVDSFLFVLFLHLTTGFPADWESVKGLIIGKFWVSLVAVPAAWTLKRAGPVAATQPEASPA